MKGYYDVVGDGGSDVLAQVRAQRERVARSLSGVRHLLAVGSGKGGVGKSTLTMQLAHALRERGNAVSILDADLNGPSQARLGALREGILLPGEGGAPVPTTRSGIGVVSTGALVPEPRPIDFPSVARGSSHTWRATRELSVLGDLLAGMSWGELDFLLVDLPPGVERMASFAELLGPSTAFLLVTLPSDLARGVVSRSVVALGETPNRVLGYVENMKGYHCPGCHRVGPLFPSGPEAALDLPCLGSVPFDPHLAELCDRGGSPAESAALSSWQPVQRIADAVCRRLREGRPPHLERR